MCFPKKATLLCIIFRTTQNYMSYEKFKKKVWRHYRENGRVFPWRKTRDPYKILVSEIMLQQTQADRIVPKYEIFIKRFPNIKTLAQATLQEVLTLWKGLGYNRRALNLKRAAEIIVEKHSGKVPKDFDALVALPSIGPATASDILIFAWNIPYPLIETNIREVYIHFFFHMSRQLPEKKKISDKELIPLIDNTFDRKNPREWVYALMDYGAMLKKTHGSLLSKQSVHYKKQTPFKGSLRQKRAHILFAITNKSTSEKEIAEKTCIDRETVRGIVEVLIREGFIKRDGKKLSIA